MILLDTHAWVWLVGDKKKLTRKAATAIESASRIGVCDISLWEVAMLVDHGRLNFDRDLEEWLEQASAVPGLEVIPLTPAIAAGVTKLGREFHGDPADRIIASSALTHRAKLVTKDDRLRKHKPLKCVW